MKKVIEEVKKDPFRQFGSISPEWRKHETGFEFLLRPFKPSELAIMKNMENEQENHSRMAFRETARSMGVDLAKLHADLEKEETRSEALELWRKLNDAHTYTPDLDMVERHEERATDIILRCVSKIRFEGDETEFTREMAEAPESYNLRLWIAGELMKSSAISESERLGL